MTAYEQVLRSAVGLFYASDTVDRSSWKNYVQTLQLDKFYPGILGLGYTARIKPNELDRFTNRVRAEGFPDFTVWPQTARDDYFSIIYLEPFEGRNLRAFGFDMFTQKNRKEAMLRAWQTGEPALSKMVTLVQEINKDVQKGCLLYLPVYDENMPINTVEERQAALQGFVYSPFRMNDLMQGILGTVAGEIEIELYDGRHIDTAQLIYTSHGYNNQKSKADFSVGRNINIAGNDWTLVLTTREAFLSSFEANQPNIIAVAGVLVNLLLLLILVKINRLSKRNMELAESYKSEKDRYEIVSEITHEIIWEWKLPTNTVSFNKIFPTLIGLQKAVSELPFDAWISYIHPGDKDRIMDKMTALLNSDNLYWSDEFRLVKADGTVVNMLARGQIIHDTSGNPVSMIGSMDNITERKQVEDAQRRFKEELEKTVQQRTAALQRSNEDLESFAHVTSHDLKEPVRRMLITVGQIQAKYQNSLGEGVSLLDKLSKAASRLNQMIESILMFSTINYESKKIEVVDLNIIIQNVAEDLELVIAEKQAEISYQPLPAIEGSSALLHQLLYNLVNNSLKFSKPVVKPYIHIDSQVRKTGTTETVEIKIIDNGIGFSQGEARKIFNSFVRLHSKDKYEGTGLGLALCKRIVERHHGTIEATGSLDHGATFIITLPVKQPAEVI